ncbi:MAG: hypothetical protein QW119_03485, partial [Candidatus Methanomethylicaceae archaeon]
LTQQFRCTKCGIKYRRIPLKGKCIKCNNNIVLTVHEGNISKYLDAAYTLAKDFQVDSFLQQQIKLIERSLKELIYITNKKEASLDRFFTSQ